MKLKLLLSLLLLSSIITNAQTIKGTITDGENKLEDANIIVKSTKRGTTSDANGEFKIEAKKNDTLSISYLCYSTKNIVITDKNNIEVILKVDNTLDEVVLIGYQSTTYKCCYSCFVKVTKITENNKAIVKSKLFPNPSSTGVFSLQLLKNYNQVEVQVTNLSGQILQQHQFNNVSQPLSLDLSQFNSGIYLRTIVADGEKLPSKKAIKP
jgi:hypothetical protein